MNADLILVMEVWHSYDWLDCLSLHNVAQKKAFGSQT